MSLAFYLNIVTGGLLTGLVYGLAALGLALIFNVVGVINLAHGGVLVAGMLAASWVAAARGADPLLALPAVAAGLFVAGFLLQRLVIGRLDGSPESRRLPLMLGIGLMAMNGLVLLAGPNGRAAHPPNAADALSAGPLLFDRLELRAALIALMVTAVLVFFFNVSRTGKALRACADSPFGARVAGLDVARLRAVAFGLGAAVTGTAGCLLAQIGPVRPALAPGHALTAFVIVLIGGLGSVEGALFGGLAVGVAEALGDTLLGPDLKSLPGCLLALLILLWRPGGFAAVTSSETAE